MFHKVLIGPWLSLYVGIRRHIKALGVLYRVCSEDSYTWRVLLDPLVPPGTPAVVVDEHLALSNLSHLCFQPLINRVFHVKPHANLKFTLACGKLFQVSKIFSRLAVGIRSLSLSEAAVLMNDSVIFGSFRRLKIHLRVKKTAHVLYTTTKNIEAFCLVEPHLLQVVPGVLLENQSSVPTEHVSFIERSQDFLDKVDVSEAFR